MYKMTKRILLPLLILAFALPSFGQKGPAKDGTGMGEGRMHQELKLTDEQEAQMQELRYSHQKELINLKANLQTAQL
ncbi:MAG: hypothetical protein K9M55_11610, partial [Candidatus Marinimicrobia bacterium]|nr:hypothetical protein [Candidatus Neomarinimicrobiota bacterium]MCF7923336.1 hypothetical protein [Candidatus Neomarinimicrobiota bacterium]